jgi:HlyD family secretion protein
MAVWSRVHLRFRRSIVRRACFGLAAVAVVGLSGCGQASAQNVQVAHAAARAVNDQPGGLGTVAAEIQVAVILNIPGYRNDFTITDVMVQPGQHISANDPLFSVDPAPFIARTALLQQQAQAAQSAVGSAQQQLSAAQSDKDARIAKAQQTVASDQTLLDSLNQRLAGEQANGQTDAAAQTSADIAKAQASLAKAQSDLRNAQNISLEHINARLTALNAKASLSNQLLAVSNNSSPTIVSPIDGDIGLSVPSPGQDILPNHTVVQIIDATNVQVTATLPVSEEANVTPGAPADVTFNSLPSVDLQGTVTSILPQAVNNGLSFQVLVTASNTPDKKVLPGAQGFVRLHGTHQAGVAVPKLAVLNIDQDPIVFVIQGQTAHLRHVSIGVQDDTWVEILSGVTAGEQCVVIGTQLVSDGTPVRITGTDAGS